ncbi:hypothetical protein ABZS76_18800 [Streptomyces sp. NPDC005562]|uniref:hypothetical protein n=1 Tax=Streptomyces sp. NPDC005562 TaxID=3154890 RepID=UPI0033AF40C9
MRDDVARLSPLTFKTLDVLGRYSFPPPSRARACARDPDAPELDDDDGGVED